MSVVKRVLTDLKRIDHLNISQHGGAHGYKNKSDFASFNSIIYFLHQEIL